MYIDMLNIKILKLNSLPLKLSRPATQVMPAHLLETTSVHPGPWFAMGEPECLLLLLQPLMSLSLVQPSLSIAIWHKYSPQGHMLHSFAFFLGSLLELFVPSLSCVPFWACRCSRSLNELRDMPVKEIPTNRQLGS